MKALRAFRAVQTITGIHPETMKRTNRRMAHWVYARQLAMLGMSMDGMYDREIAEVFGLDRSTVSYGRCKLWNQWLYKIRPVYDDVEMLKRLICDCKPTTTTTTYYSFE